MAALGILFTIIFWKAGPARHPAISIHALAVLPFENLSGDQGRDYFADSMTDELITVLAKNAGLRVISRTSVMQYKKSHRPLRDIARELGGIGMQLRGDSLTLNLFCSWSSTYENGRIDEFQSVSGELHRTLYDLIATVLLTVT